MSLDIRDKAPAPTALSEHAAIPIAFVVDRVLRSGSSMAAWVACH
jgi:hypothetical protein